MRFSNSNLGRLLVSLRKLICPSSFLLKSFKKDILGRMYLATSHCILQLEGEFSLQLFRLRRRGGKSYHSHPKGNTENKTKKEKQKQTKNKIFSLASSKNQIIKKLYSLHSHPASLL